MPITLKQKMRRNWVKIILISLPLIVIGALFAVSLSHQDELKEAYNNSYSALCNVSQVYSGDYIEIDCEIPDNKGEYTNVYKNMDSVIFQIYWDAPIYLLDGYASINDIKKGDTFMMGFKITNVEGSVIRIVDIIAKK